jgi:hypothetical protein
MSWHEQKIAACSLRKLDMNPIRTPARQLAAFMLAIALASTACAAQQPSTQVSDASAVPIAISVALPVVLVGGVATIAITSVEASADGVTWVVENSVDGVKGSVRFTGQAVGVASVAIGTVITVTAVDAGLVLSAAGRVIAFVPNAIGRTLTYNQRVSQ